MSDVTVGTLPAKPGDVPGLVKHQDDARQTALDMYNAKGLPCLRDVFDDPEASHRLKLDATKLLQQVAIPPPPVHIGDIDIAILVDL